MVDDPWRRHAEALLTRERDVHGLLAGTDVPAPRTLGARRAAATARGDPSLLMTRLPRGGRPGRATHPRGAGGPAARDPRRPCRRRGSGRGDYQSWAVRVQAEVPPWSGRRRALPRGVRAAGRARAGVRPDVPAPRLPPGQRALVRDGRVTGRRGLGGDVDRAGRPRRRALRLEPGRPARRRGRARLPPSRTSTGAACSPRTRDAAAYWQLLDLVAFLPDPLGRESGGTAGGRSSGPGADTGRPDLRRADVARSRREDLLRAVLVRD